MQGFQNKPVKYANFQKKRITLLYVTNYYVRVKDLKSECEHSTQATCSTQALSETQSTSQHANH